jgi:hypothetical protein
MNDQHLLEAVRRAAPASAEIGEAPDALFERVLASARAEVRPRSSVRRPRRRRHAPRWAVAVGAAAVVAVVAVAVTALLPAGDSGGPSPAAAAVLLHTARTAASQPAIEPPGPGQFVYTKSDGEFQDTAVTQRQTINYYQHVTREIWIAPDGSGRIHETEGLPQFVTNADRQAWLAAGKPELTGDRNADQTFGAGGLHYLDLSKLPTDPAQLKQLIDDRTVEGGPPGDAETFTIIGDLLRETYAPPALRSALYTIAADLPGVQLIGAVHDQLGRPGTAVAYTSQGLRHELIFDPRTSVLLGEQMTVADPSQATALTGEVVESTTYLTSGVVDSTTTTP